MIRLAPAPNVHERAEAIDVDITCGDVGGQMLGNSLVIGLRVLNDSEQAGIAILEEMGDQTQVANFLQDQEFGESTAGPGRHCNARYPGAVRC
jgi:hypothetical protein